MNINGSVVTLKTGSGENRTFLVGENTQYTVKESQGGNAGQSWDATVNVKGTTISTKQDSSGGIHVAGGGTLNATNVSAAGDGGAGYCDVYISKDSKRVVTADSRLSASSCAGTIEDANGNSASVVDGDGKILEKATTASRSL